MANKEITDLTAATVLTGAEKFHVDQGGNSREAGVDDVATFVQTDKIDKIADTLVVEVFAPDQDIEVGDGAAYFMVPASQNGRNCVEFEATIITPATGSGSETVDIQIVRVRSGTPVDVLSTKLTVDEDEYSSNDAATPAVIDAANDDVATEDLYRVDIDAVPSTTPGTGLQVAATWQKP